jgi:2-isopropylmalate synthase
MDKVFIYDTTLRDGSQSEEIEFSVEDKIAVAHLLDQKVDFIEGGFPAHTNAKDLEFYRRMKKRPLRHATLVAFGSTRRAKYTVSQDPSLQSLLDAGTPAVAIVGKTWDLHVHDVLRISLEENLKIIRESVAYLKSKKRQVLFDAEHFFDAYAHNREYAEKVLLAASQAGADWIVLCDTNGGALPERLGQTVAAMARLVPTPLGIHAHNDSEMAVANSLAGIGAGAAMVQGTINGYGERCGNANLCSLLPTLQLKMGKACLRGEHLRELTTLARTVAEIANVPPRDYSAYVGYNAFAHKGGLHVDAVQKNPVSYEHVPPESVGNERRIIISEQSGVASVLFKAAQMGVKLEPGSDSARAVIERVKVMEHAGYKFEGADASFRLLLERHLKKHKRFFELEGFRVAVERREDKLISEATIKVKVQGKSIHTAAEGDGPVNALDNALRKALEPHFPGLKKMHLVDYKVRVLDSKAGTEAKVRVFIESQDQKRAWGTVGLSPNIIEASWEALVDAIEYKLHSDRGWKQ